MQARPAFDPDRFLEAQERVLDDVRRELSAGRKRTHWMWFVFPQLAGLGRSPTAVHYALGSAAAARAWLVHPVLGARLVDCTERVLGSGATSARAVFDPPDDLKFASSMTLFEHVSEPASVYARALDRLCGGTRDPATIALLADH